MSVRDDDHYDDLESAECGVPPSEVTTEYQRKFFLRVLEKSWF